MSQAESLFAAACDFAIHHGGLDPSARNMEGWDMTATVDKHGLTVSLILPINAPLSNVTRMLSLKTYQDKDDEPENNELPPKSDSPLIKEINREPHGYIPGTNKRLWIVDDELAIRAANPSELAYWLETGQTPPRIKHVD